MTRTRLCGRYRNGLVNLSCFAGRSALLYDTDTESIKVFKISQVTPGTIPMSLLLLADPSERSVASYCDGALCYLATEDGAALGASVFNTRCKDVLELFNIAVAPRSRRGALVRRSLNMPLRMLESEGTCALSLELAPSGISWPSINVSVFESIRW